MLTQVLTNFEENFAAVGPVEIIKLALSLTFLIVTLYVIARQPVSSCSLAFKVPFVPWVPGFSLLINIYLMIKLDLMTWIRFSIWIAIGLVIFFSYSIRNSRLRQRSDLRSLADFESNGHSEVDSIASCQREDRFRNQQVPLMVMQQSSS